MATALPKMSYCERQARVQAKRQLILKFLASGEVFSNSLILSRITGSSISSVERTLQQLIREGCIKSEQHYIQSRKTNIWGITSHGLALADEFNNPAFDLGRTASNFIPHHIETQKARLAAEAAGFTHWRPGRSLRGAGLAKIPDAVCTSPTGHVIALEIERHAKTQARYKEIIAAHLQMVAQKKWAEVHYLCPPDLFLRVQKLFEKIEVIKIKGDSVKLERKHRDRFKFYDLAKWPGYQFNIE